MPYLVQLKQRTLHIHAYKSISVIHMKLSVFWSTLNYAACSNKKIQQQNMGQWYFILDSSGPEHQIPPLAYQCVGLDQQTSTSWREKE